jgi:hypothetical protein
MGWWIVVLGVLMVSGCLALLVSPEVALGLGGFVVLFVGAVALGDEQARSEGRDFGR